MDRGRGPLCQRTEGTEDRGAGPLARTDRDRGPRDQALGQDRRGPRTRDETTNWEHGARSGTVCGPEHNHRLMDKRRKSSNEFVSGWEFLWS